MLTALIAARIGSAAVTDQRIDSIRNRRRIEDADEIDGELSDIETNVLRDSSKSALDRGGQQCEVLIIKGVRRSSIFGLRCERVIASYRRLLPRLFRFSLELGRLSTETSDSPAYPKERPPAPRRGREWFKPSQRIFRCLSRIDLTCSRRGDNDKSTCLGIFLLFVCR